MKLRNQIYKLTFPDGKVYIGCTSDVKRRWAGDGKHYKSQRVWTAIEKYGWENVNKEVIIDFSGCQIDECRIKQVEKAFIVAYSGKSYNDKSDPTWEEERRAVFQNRTKKSPRERMMWTAFGETKSAIEWCEQYNINMCDVQRRINRYGLTIEQALSEPPIPREYRNKPKQYWKKKGFM